MAKKLTIEKQEVFVGNKEYLKKWQECARLNSIDFVLDFDKTITNPPWIDCNGQYDEICDQNKKGYTTYDVVLQHADATMREEMQIVKQFFDYLQKSDDISEKKSIQVSSLIWWDIYNSIIARCLKKKGPNLDLLELTKSFENVKIKNGFQRFLEIARSKSKVDNCKNALDSPLQAQIIIATCGLVPIAKCLLENHRIDHSDIKFCGNDFEIVKTQKKHDDDDDAIKVEFVGPQFTILNKHIGLSNLKSHSKCLVLIGDKISDTKMVYKEDMSENGDNTMILRIGFAYLHPLSMMKKEKIIENFLEHFDIVILNCHNFDEINRILEEIC